MEAQARILKTTHGGIEKFETTYHIEPCLSSPNRLHTPIPTDGGVFCSNCGIELASFLETSLQRDIATEVAGYQPTPNFLFGKGLGTDLSKTIQDLRGPKRGGSLYRVNRRRSKGDKTPEHLMKSEENTISPEGQSYAQNHIVRDQKEKEQVENKIRETAHRLLQKLPQYKEGSAQWLMWADTCCRIAVKKFREDLRKNYMESEDGVSRADGFAYLAIREVLPANVFQQFKNGKTK